MSLGIIELLSLRGLNQRAKGCNNALLRELIDSAPATYPRRFRFSILQILSKTAGRDDLLERESLFKQKLGSRAIGLNLN